MKAKSSVLRTTLFIGVLVLGRLSFAEAPSVAGDRPIGSAPGGPQTTVLENVTRRFDKPFLWRVSGDSGKSSYVFGSIHLPSDHFAPLPEVVLKAFEEADVVLGEIPYDEESMRQAAAAAQSAQIPLSKRLPADLYARFTRKLARLAPDVDPALLENMEAWCVALQLVVLEAPSSLVPMDFMFYRQAVNDGKEAGGLESVEEELKAMQMSDEDQVNFFRATLDDMDAAERNGETTARQMVNAYLSGDLDVLGKLFNRAQEGFTPTLREHFGETILNARNQKMAERMLERMGQHPAKCHLFVVGAMHFAGEGNILERLKNKGFKVERILK
ncbi:MAG: TraB/GumN family protein [Verrucomicrobiota bacterium]